MHTSDEQTILDLVIKANPGDPIEYVNKIVRPYANENLNNLISECEDCPLSSQCERVHSVTHGDVQKSVLMIINEGIFESQVNGKEIVEPLIGTEEMEIIQKVLDWKNVNQDYVYWMNAVNCYTNVVNDGKVISRTPNVQEIENCREYVRYAINMLRPIAIILLGNIPLNMFVKGQAINRVRGNWIDINGIKTMPTYNPKMIVKGEKDGMTSELLNAYKQEFCDDFSAVFDYINETIEATGMNIKFMNNEEM